jgi:hypothetical protein
MQKHPRISSASLVGPCPFTQHVLLQNVGLSPYAFSRYLTRRAFVHSPAPGIRAYRLPCGCCVWRYASGIRELSALPF